VSPLQVVSSDKVQYVAYNVCASIRAALYAGTAWPDGACGHTPALLQAGFVWTNGVYLKLHELIEDLTKTSIQSN
jgi:hypothetical protein